MESLGKAAVAEFIATFALIFIGAGAVITSSAGNLDLVGVALAHGLVLAIMVSITGHISGGHVNPAVTIALWAAGKIGTQRGAVLIVAQMLGAVVGALLVRYVRRGQTPSTPAAPARRRSGRGCRSASASSSRRS